MWLNGRQPIVFAAFALLFSTLGGCSDGEEGPTGSSEPARVAGLITADAGSVAAIALSGVEETEEPLTGASVRLVGPGGETLFDTETDSSGEFELVADPGTYTLEVVLSSGETFSLDVDVDAGQRLFVQARIRGNASRPVIDAELFTDDDGDGVSDSGISIRIRGREAGRPGSGEVIDGEDPGEDLDDEEDEADDDGPASLESFREGQRVFVKGAGDPDGFVADEVHGNSGRSDGSCRLSGFLTGVEETAEGVTTVQIFGMTVNVPEAEVSGVRGGRGRHSELAEGTRVEIHATLNEDGTLEASRLHARGGNGGDAERMSGRLTAPPDLDGRILEVCGVPVTVEDGAKITNGDGGIDDEEDDGDDEDGDGDEDDGDDDGDDDGELDFDDLVAALADGGFNHDARGEFADGVLRLEKLTVADAPSGDIEIVGTVTDENLGAGTFRVLGLPLVLDAETDFGGNLGPDELGNGLRVRAEVEAEDGVLVVRSIQRAGQPDDRIRGGTLALVSSDLGADVNIAVELASGVSLQADVVTDTKLEVED